VINSILYTNSKLYKIGSRINGVCTFCNYEPENLFSFSVNALTPKRSGLISNRTGTIYRISQSTFLHKTFYLEFYPNNALYQIYLTISLYLENYFCGTAEEAKHFLKFMDCNQNLRLNMKLKKY